MFVDVVELKSRAGTDAGWGGAPSSSSVDSAGSVALVSVCLPRNPRKNTEEAIVFVDAVELKSRAGTNAGWGGGLAVFSVDSVGSVAGPT